MVALLATALTTWPLARSPVNAVLGSPSLEAVDHLWALWAGLRDGPLVIETDRLRWPEGYQWVLGDPANLPAFAAGFALGGPGLGFNLVQVTNLLLAGLAAVLAGRSFLADRAGPEWLTALIAITAAPLAGGLFTGMSEAQTMGWTVLSLAALHHALRGRRPRRVLLAGVVLGLTAWAGAYAALYAALLAPIVIIAHLISARGDRRALAVGVSQNVIVALVALLISSPVLQAIAFERASGLPGSVSIAAEVLARPDLPQNRMLGADLLGLFWPHPGANPLHAVYLGLGACLLGLAGARQARASVLLALIAASIVLAGGYYLQVGGALPGVVLPMGWLSAHVEALGRAPRWYRMAMVTAILLAPLASRGAAMLAGRWAWLPAIGLVVDAIWLSPLPFPRETFPAGAPAGFETLTADGPLIQVPPSRPNAAVGKGIRHQELLWQTHHGRALGGSPHQAEGPHEQRPAAVEARALARAAATTDPAAGNAARDRLAALGFTYVVHLPGDPGVERGLRALLGDPAVDTPELLAWAL